MKIILKNSQFNKLKSFINEAELDDTKKTILGQKLLKFYNLLSVNKSIEFILSSGTKIVLKCTKASANNFEFEILKDDKGALKQWDSLSIKIDIGDKKDGNFVDKYEKNKNIITSTNKNDGSFNLIFDASNEKGEKNKANFNSIKNILQSNLKVKDEKLNEPTNKEPTNQDPNNSETGTVDKADAKAAYEKILNNPELRNAFYKQPSFWEMFKAELKGEKPTGTGIITALDILDKYNLRQYNEKLSKMVTPNEKVTIKFLEDYTIDFVENKTITFNRIEKYVLKVAKKNTNETQGLYGKKDKIDYYLPLTNPEPEKNDDSGDVFTSKIGGKKYLFRILTGENESPGYNNESED